MAAQIAIRKEDEETETRLTFPILPEKQVQSSYGALKRQKNKKRELAFFGNLCMYLYLFPS